MKIWNSVTLLLVLGLFLFSSCSSDEAYDCCDSNIEGLAFTYGTSFGECVGYCIQEMVVTENSVQFKKRGWVDTVKTVSQTHSIEPAVWDSLLYFLDEVTFMGIPDTIGCPDCADGGAEWIEIISADMQHKVLFEYLNEPEALKDYANILRRISTCFENGTYDQSY